MSALRAPDHALNAGKPLRSATSIDITAALAGLAAIGCVAITLLRNGTVFPPGAFLLEMVLFVGGAQLISTGILGKYVGRIDRESKQRPLDLVREEAKGMAR